jgi:glycosyltransferase involved in cell wall biosynthesis
MSEISIATKISSRSGTVSTVSISQRYLIRYLMKVAHITAYLDPEHGYEENHLGPAQCDLGADVTIITSNVRVNRRATREKFEVGKTDYRGATLVRLDTVGFPWRQPAMGLRGLNEAIDSSEPDIVHLHSPVGLLTIQALRACKRRGIPVVLDSHLCYFNLRPYSRIKKAYYIAYKRLILPRYSEQIKQLLPLTPESGDLLADELGLSRDLMVHNTLGTWTNQFQPVSEGRKRVRTSLGIGADEQVIMFVGRVVPEKRVETLIEAMGTAELSAARLVIVGPIEDAYRESLIAGAGASGGADINDRMTFTGAVDYELLPDYFSAADVGVWPGDGAISIIDAMACGLPVVLSRSESTSHLIAAGNGAAYTEGDSDNLSRVLSSIISDAQKLKEMSDLSRSSAEDVFDWRQVAGRTLDIYADVLANRQSSVATIW